MHFLFNPEDVVMDKQKQENSRQFCLGLNALALSDGPKISLMETSLVSMWVASAMKSKCVVALYGGVDGHALDFLQSCI